jgi:predicted histone-like DNA-binding protein
MSIKIKAKERKLKLGDSEFYRYVMQPELYSALAAEKVIREAALRSGVSQGVMQACWDAAGSVIKAWATEGHSVALPGLGTMRFGLSAKAVEDVNDVKTGLIKTRRIVFTPSTDLKQELKDTAVIITCYDRNGVEVKRVTSTDPGTVEEPDDTDPNGTGGSSTGGNTQQGGNTGGGSNTGGNTSGDNTGGDSTGGDDYHDPDGGTNSDE